MVTIHLTENAETVLKKRYLQRDIQGRVIETEEGLFRRLSKNVTQADKFYDSQIDLSSIEEEFYDLLAPLDFFPNSPTFWRFTCSDAEAKPIETHLQMRQGIQTKDFPSEENMISRDLSKRTTPFFLHHLFKGACPECEDLLSLKRAASNVYVDTPIADKRNPSIIV